jgi:hypothetical protein
MAKNKQRRSRNPVAHHLFIHRGGVHEKSNSAKRQEDKRQLRKLVDKAGAGFSGPDFLGDTLRPTVISSVLQTHGCSDQNS